MLNKIPTKKTLQLGQEQALEQERNQGQIIQDTVLGNILSGGEQGLDLF